MLCRHPCFRQSLQQCQTSGEKMPEKTTLPLEVLDLDSENPRLPETLSRDQQTMLEFLARETSIEELMTVIGENDYFEGEPLIVYKKPKGKKYIVIEGNRRLVALRLLQNPNLYPKRKAIRQIAEAAKHKPPKAPVVIFKQRRDVLTYLGYRHITGVRPWEPLAKARYMHQLFLATGNGKRKADETYRAVAREIGSRRDHIKRSLDALAVYNEIEKKGFFDIVELDETSINFSLLSTALGYPSISKFAGCDDEPIRNVSSVNLPNVELLTRWMFEKKGDGETLLGESRNIGKLASIVESPKALEALKKGASLDAAYHLTAGIQGDFTRHLYEAQTSLQNANAVVASVEPTEEILVAARDVQKLARNVVVSLNAAKDEQF